MQHTFFVHFFAVVLHESNVKLSETSCLQLVSRFMEEMSYFFSTGAHGAHFHLSFDAASISYFLTAATKFPSCSFNKISVSFVFYLSLSPPPSLSLSLFCRVSLRFFPPITWNFPGQDFFWELTIFFTIFRSWWVRTRITWLPSKPRVLFKYWWLV